MKSKYTKIKYTNTGVKAPVVTLVKSRPNIGRSDMIELKYPEIKVTIKRISRKTLYTRAQSVIGVMKDNFIVSYFVYDTINDARIVCENIYLIIKKPELDFCINSRDYDNLFEYMKVVLYNAEES